MGSDAQEELNVGIGTLAGSTVMLLTIPWFVAVFAGRVNLNPQTGRPTMRHGRGKLVPEGHISLWHTGVGLGESVTSNGVVMAITALGYVSVQGAAFQHCYMSSDDSCEPSQEKVYAVISLVYAVCGFVGYLSLMVYNQHRHQKGDHCLTLEKTVKRICGEIDAGRLSLSHVIKRGVLHNSSKAGNWFRGNAQQTAQPPPQGEDAKLTSPAAAQELSRTLSQEPLENNDAFEKILRRFFARYDKDNDGLCDTNLLPVLLHDLGEHVSVEEHNQLMAKMDTNSDGHVEFREFKVQILEFLHQKCEEYVFWEHLVSSTCLVQDTEDEGCLEYGSVAHEEEEEHQEVDEVDIPESWKHLSCEERERKILKRAFVLMSWGLLLIILFSDPMVDVMFEVGNRMNIKSFYVAFVLAPVASNASEVMAAYLYGSKKTVIGTTTACETLVGAAIMNNTFVLAVFLFVVVIKDLKWEYTAETLSILIVEAIMFLYTRKKTQRLIDGFVILSLYPLAMGLVAFFEEVVGLN
eukprot:TRINITY_DN11341_c0_g1_i2.p1 TRINITY_DN11341_c0_g1~~TRINITY_DN11341_c0_g1_i2.p1  ORF type:complete len:521 (-),score=172.96 TRINITY_DN11341_c0_g1_i2:181-1743(-)